MPNFNSNDAEYEHANEDRSIPPIWNLFVPAHQARMDIWLLMQAPSTLNPDLLAEVQQRMHDRCRNARKAQPIAQRKRCGQEQRGIRMVRLLVKRALRRQNPRHIVLRTAVVVACPGANRQVARKPRVRVVHDRGQEPEEKHETSSDVRLRPPRRRERAANVRDLAPIEGDEGHAEPR